jgi:hypothetical protein
MPSLRKLLRANLYWGNTGHTYGFTAIRELPVEPVVADAVNGRDVYSKITYARL